MAALIIDGVYRGKRITAATFLDGLEKGFAQCDVIFGWDIAEDLVPGLRFTGWQSGYPDILMIPDLDTFAVVPWEPGSGHSDRRLRHGAR